MYAIELNGTITAEEFTTFADAKLAACDFIAAKYKDGVPDTPKVDVIRYVKTDHPDWLSYQETFGKSEKTTERVPMRPSLP
jgi:hypothetical protein